MKKQKLGLAGKKRAEKVAMKEQIAQQREQIKARAASRKAAK